MKKEFTISETDWLAEVKRQVESLRFGVVVIEVHGGRATKLERTEKLRLNQHSSTGPIDNRQEP